MKNYNVSAMMVYKAESREQAEKMAYNALSLIPKGENPEYYEVTDVCEDLSAEPIIKNNSTWAGKIRPR